MGEFPLVVFTVLSQMGVGAFITLFFLDSYKKIIPVNLGQKLTLGILGITGGGLIFSLLHLGHPLNAYRALTNLGNSWLSREVILFSAFVVLIVLYYFQWQDGNTRRKAVGLAGSLIGLAGVVASGMVYVLPAVPAWNNFSPVLFFLLTAAVLGPLFVLVFLKLKDSARTAVLLPLSGILLINYFLLFILYTSVLLSGGEGAALTAAHMLASPSFWVRVFLTWVLPLALLIWIWKNKKQDFQYLIGLFVLVLAGEFIGRYLFYNTAVFLKIAGF